MGNQFKTKKKRLEVLEILRQSMLELLIGGYNPFMDTREDKGAITISDAINIGVKHKLLSWSATNKDTSIVRIRVFKRYLEEKQLLNRPVGVLNKKIINDFLDTILQKTTPVNRNNYRSSISPVFTYLVDRDIIPINYFLQTKKEKEPIKGKKVYSKKLKDDILSWLKQNDPILLKFIQLFTLGMIRPIEAVRLKVKDINLEERYFYVHGKTKKEKKKLIPKLLMDVMPDISFAHPEHYIVTKSGVGFWDLSAKGRRDFFTKRFNRMRNTLGFDKNLKMYNFRHTIISNIYENLIKVHGKTKANELLMEITGHATQKALHYYLNTIDAYLPEDFSKHID